MWPRKPRAGESGADGLDARADAAGEPAARLAGDVGASSRAAAARTGGRGSRLGGRALPRTQARVAGLKRGSTRGGAARGDRDGASAGRRGRRATSAVRQLVRLKGVATTGASVLVTRGWCGGRSGIVGRLAGSSACATRTTVVRRCESKASVGRERAAASTSVSWPGIGSGGNRRVLDAVVSSAVCDGATRASDRDCSRRAQVGDRLWRYVTTGDLPAGAL